MRFKIFNRAGNLAVAAHQRATLDSALDWANELIANRTTPTSVSILDEATGEKYDEEAIAELNRHRESGYA
jgi:hypothetical protein